MAKGLGLKTMLSRFPPSVRGHVVAAIGELVGTTAFLFFAFAGTQVANISSNNDAGGNVVSTTPDKNPAQLLYISLVFGFSLAVNVWTFVRVSGGLFS
jgi:aquaporin related protein